MSGRDPPSELAAEVVWKLHCIPLPHAPLLLLLDLYPIAIKKYPEEEEQRRGLLWKALLSTRRPRFSTSSSQLGTTSRLTTSVCDQRLQAASSCWLYSVGRLPAQLGLCFRYGSVSVPSWWILFLSAPVVSLPAPHAFRSVPLASSLSFPPLSLLCRVFMGNSRRIIDFNISSQTGKDLIRIPYSRFYAFVFMA